VRLRLTDIDWNSGTLQVTGKGRYQVRLPLPQDVGDALLRYLEYRPANLDTDHVFIRSIAPCRPFASGDGVSSVVKHALKRANIDSPDPFCFRCTAHASSRVRVCSAGARPCLGAIWERIEDDNRPAVSKPLNQSGISSLVP
jgi:integrase